jgi:hypothetical protein
MNYQNIYDSLIIKRKANPATGYVEKHHIIPKSLGGSNDSANLVVLTGREHWVAHLLLWKITRHCSMAHACHMMAMRCKERGIPFIRNSRMYERVRIECIKLWSQNGKKRIKENNGAFGTHWISNINLKKNLRVSKTLSIPEGWVLGRNVWEIIPLLTKEQRREIIIKIHASRSEDERQKVIEKLKKYRPSEDTMSKLRNRTGSNNPAYGIKFKWANDGKRNYKLPRDLKLLDNFVLGKIRKIQGH